MTAPAQAVPAHLPRPHEVPARLWEVERRTEANGATLARIERIAWALVIAAVGSIGAFGAAAWSGAVGYGELRQESAQTHEEVQAIRAEIHALREP